MAFWGALDGEMEEIVRNWTIFLELGDNFSVVLRFYPRRLPTKFEQS